MKRFFEKKEVSAQVETAEEKPRRVPLTHRTWAKVSAFLLVIVMVLATVASGFAAAAMVSFGMYTTPLSNLRYECLRGLATNDAQRILNYLSVDDTAAERDAMQYLSGRNIANVSVAFTPVEVQPSGEDGIIFYENTFNLPMQPYTGEETAVSVPQRFADGGSWGYSGGHTAASTPYCTTWYCYTSGDGYFYYAQYFGNDDVVYEEGRSLVGTAEVTVLLANTMTEQDEYFFVDTLIRIAYAMRYWVYVVGVGAFFAAIACFVFLMCASGRRALFDMPQPGWGTRVPFDLLTVGVLLAAFLAAEISVEAHYFHSAVKTVIVWVGMGTALLIIALGWCMSLAVRLKLGAWWKNTLIYRALHLAVSLARKLAAALRRAVRAIASLGRAVPLVWKSAACFAAVAAVELLVTAFSWGEGDVLFVFWFCKNAAFFAFVLVSALMLRRLQRGGEALAAGDLAYQVETNRLLWDFKRHGENLNRIGEGMSAAVEQRLKSERMKTELITNVSHDIKTPLTSIINYADLIGKEPCENAAITEYAAVLHRQSERLKRLIDDLVEASKASTGNLDVQLVPCEVGVLLTQAAGEYEQRLRERGLELVTKQPDHPVKILSDGRRLWRVFDNLMGNVCKYAQSGTRVYLTLEESAGQAVISLKNTSREMLDLSPDELLERFVRGDAARGSEGNGLGLSIAKSLTELQGGRLELATDGDLFKVVLRFAVIN